MRHRWVLALSLATLAGTTGCLTAAGALLSNTTVSRPREGAPPEQVARLRRARGAVRCEVLEARDPPGGHRLSATAARVVLWTLGGLGALVELALPAALARDGATLLVGLGAGVGLLLADAGVAIRDARRSPGPREVSDPPTWVVLRRCPRGAVLRWRDGLWSLDAQGRLLPRPLDVPGASALWLDEGAELATFPTGTPAP